ncbi:hypothetical protein K3495_g1223 [Podosphaera aphanis]|nr:hypothetical protein K3495_g1223 [Podosphaera aphanis]
MIVVRQNTGNPNTGNDNGNGNGNGNGNESGGNGNNPPPATSDKGQASTAPNGDTGATKTFSLPNTKSMSGTARPSGSGSNSDSETASQSTSYDARLPAGGIAMITPAVSLGQQFFKIGDFVTFAWNYTSLEAAPTAVNVMATCTANKQLYTIQMNQTVANSTGGVVWDTGSYQATAVQDPLLTQTYTLIIYDADSSISATAQPGYLAVYSQYTFGMYSPQPYTPLGDFRCATCSGGLSDIERQALGMVLGMGLITVMSFTWFVRGFGVTW